MPRSSLFLSVGALLLALAAPSSQSVSYTLKDDYSTNFFDKFDFFTDTDPTHGFVKYLDQASAQTAGLIDNNKNGGIYMGVDALHVVTQGRPSVRITSKAKYNHGLIILSLNHMPDSTCGSWPAFWTLGDGTWPHNGEVDIIEGVNNQVGNLMSLHTDPGCSIDGTGQTGTTVTHGCANMVAGQPDYAGCGIRDPQGDSYGSGLDAVGGGTFAMEWTSDYIRIYHFPGNSAPSNIASGNPDPSTWGLPVSNFQGACKIDNFFQDHRIIFDTTFCGDFGNALWSSAGCQASTGYQTCPDYVANNPTVFQNTFWSIQSLKVYTKETR
ncbi:MAG: hypothetical protein M1829_001771 [Trizodia sp. TS-e1964]|nr:MAG: hypothetical protein M1829_001771 [Trizodia sp. TS-e1964]